jgi:O-antigen/teichoic acid export membrane protein
MNDNPVSPPGLSIRKIVGLSSVYGISPILDRALAILLLPVFTHYLSTDSYGSLMLLYASANVVQLFIFMGFPDALTKIYWDYKGRERKECLGTAWVTTLGLNIIAAVPIIVFADRIAVRFFDNAPIAFLILLILARITLATQAIIPMIIFRVREQKYHVLSANLINIFIRVAFTLLFLIPLKMGLAGIFLAEICANVSVLLFYVPVLIRETRPSFHIRYLKNILSLSYFQFISEILAWIISLSDRLIIQHMLRDPSEVGVYALGYTFGSVTILLIRPIFTAWHPYIYGVNSQSGEEYDRQMGEFFLFYIAVCLGVFLLISSLSPDVIRILTPPFYHRAGSLVTVILTGHILANVSNYFLSNFFLAGKMQLISIVYFVCAAANVSLNYALIPGYGIMGAAWATLVSYALMFGMICHVSQRIRRIPIALKPIGVVVAAAAALWVLTMMADFENPFVSLAARSGILAVFLVPPAVFWYRRVK